MTESNALLKKSLVKNSLFSAQGVAERIFTLGFKGFVYNQIWEDPRVDLEALQLKPTDRLLTISSGGCNVLNYLTADPAEVHAVDLNPNHMALTRLKIAALHWLPDYEHFWRFFGIAKDPANVKAYKDWLRHRLDDATRKFWDGSSVRPLIRRSRIRYFSNGLYKHAALGRLMHTLRSISRLFVPDYEVFKTFKTLDEQTAHYDRYMAPVVAGDIVKFFANTPFGPIGLGIPPQQKRLVEKELNVSFFELCQQRARRMFCGFPLADNYFLYMVLYGGYDPARKIVPPYLREENYEFIKSRVNRVTTQVTSTVEFMKKRPANSLEAVVLLDSQDWMNPRQVREQWEEIHRVVSPGGRIIFRTGGVKSPVEEALADSPVRGAFTYHAAKSAALHAKDRSAIYGAFHLYTLDK